MPDESMPGDAAGLRAAKARLRELLAERDAEVAALRAGQDADREVIRRPGLRLAELERQLDMDSSDSGTPSSKERIGAKEARRARQQSERERSKDRRRGGQPGHQGKGLERDPSPGEKRDAPPPAECRSCRAPLDSAEAAEPRWAQVIDVALARTVTEWALPGLSCPCCGAVTFAEPPPGAHQGSVCYGPRRTPPRCCCRVTGTYRRNGPRRSSASLTAGRHPASARAQHVIRRCRAVTKLGPGGVQDWAGDIIAVLCGAHAAVEAARARGDTALDPEALDDLRERYDTAVRSGIIHSRTAWWRFATLAPRSETLLVAPGLNNDLPGYQWGAGHAMELAYLWPSFNNGYSLYDLLTPAQLGLSRQMVRYWGAFAATGAPRVPGQPAWPGYASGQLLSLRPGGQTQAISAATFGAEHQCSFWNAS